MKFADIRKALLETGIPEEELDTIVLGGTYILELKSLQRIGTEVIFRAFLQDTAKGRYIIVITPQQQYSFKSIAELKKWALSGKLDLQKSLSLLRKNYIILNRLVQSINNREEE